MFELIALNLLIGNKTAVTPASLFRHCKDLIFPDFKMQLEEESVNAFKWAQSCVQS